jgi:effector-binding domain-containing protein
MVMQVGMPTSAPVSGEGRIFGGTLPGGRYLSLKHTGPYGELRDVNMALGEYARAHSHHLDGNGEGEGFAGATRLEIYHDPGNRPGAQPMTEVAFRLAD